MEFTSYPLVAANTGSLNTGSYLNRTEYTLFVNGYVPDLWFGFSANDVIEYGVWDRSNNFVGWNVLNQSKSFNEITLSYLNTLDYPVTYSYAELLTDFTLYKNEKVLVNPAEELQQATGLTEGSFFFVYNFTREMAGNINEPLVIKEVSPSRKELKLVPLSSSNANYDAFCKKKVLLSDVSPLYLKSVAVCPYEQIYGKVSSQYVSEINTIKQVFFLNTDGAMVKFLKNLYEDFLIFTTVPKISDAGISTTNDRLIRIQGIQTYFTNYLLSNSNTVVDFKDVDVHFNGFVSASIERKFSPIGEHPAEQYVKAKAFIYDFFTKYYYQPVSDVLASTYNEKYYSYLKNGLNLGNNRVLPILNTGLMDERVEPTDPLTLLVKLQSELPNDIMARTHCWVSNISLAPYVVNAIVRTPTSKVVHKIGAPNFSVPIPNVSLTNANIAYTAEDLQEDSEINRELTVSKNLGELNVDYTDFQNFVVFSSAELRVKIFKNKAINLAALTASMATLEAKNTQFFSASGSTYPFYAQEKNVIQDQMTEIVTSFDGYESYLYRSGDFAYSGSGFISSSFVAETLTSASYYDKNNRDSLINNCPAHIMTDEKNDDYITFLSMVGHFFDGIYAYITNIPSEKKFGQTATEEFTRRIVDYMLETFGWNLDDSLEQSSLLQNYLTDDQVEGLASMSAEDRLKTVRNRIFVNLPQIFKSKGTEESVRLLLACYGIPSVLLSVREFGGVNYTDDTAAYTIYERAYLKQWHTSSVHDYLSVAAPSNAKTFLGKMSVDSSEPYSYGEEQILFGRVSGSAVSSSISGSGEWSVGFVRVPMQNSGKLFFQIGYKNNPQFKIYTPAFPLFDGDVYSLMLRRNTPSTEYEENINVDAVPCRYDLYVQKNESGQRAVYITASSVCYEASVNQFFDVSNTGSNIMIGGWFADHNGQGYTGTFDKFQMWYDPITDSNFEDYVNHINSYSFSGSRDPQKSLLFRMHTDYPFNLRQSSASADVWTGSWQNANTYYAVSSSQKQEEEFNVLYAPSIDWMTSYNAWHGAEALVSSSCAYVSQSIYPFQFEVVDYPSTLATSKYGPNKFRNEKIRHVSQSVATRFDDKDRSTFMARNSSAPDSNQVGFFVDPQDFKNRDIVRFFGNFDFMDAIGNPNNQFSGSYQSLRNFRKTYSDAKNENSGSRTLFNELITLYKFYFNRSIFEAIKNLTPARSNVLVGVIVEPTVLERPKYHAKPVYSEANTGSVFYADITASHYFRDPNTKLTRLTESIEYADFNVDSTYASQFNTASLPNNRTIDINVAYINLPSANYPVNYLPWGTYISDVPDKFQFGHYGSSELLTTPIVIPPAPVSASFYASPVYGNAPMFVTFTNTSTGADTFNWDFGDGTSSSVESPVHTYTSTGSFTVRLSATGSGGMDMYNAASYITTFNTIACVSVSQSFQVSTTASYSQSVTLGTDTGVVKLVWATHNVADRLVVNWGGTTVIDTGYVAKTGSAYFNKTSEFPAVASITASTLAADSQGSYEIQCPDTTIACVALSQSYTFNSALPQTSSVVLGTDTGIVELFYAAQSVPDRFVLSWNGVNVIDTGFQSGTGSYIFNKTTAYPVTATLTIYGSTTTSGGSVRVSCPS
jgi:PKD repeat protein